MNDSVQHEPEQSDHQPGEGDDMVEPEPGRHRHRQSRVERCMVNGHVVCSVVQDGVRSSWIEGLEDLHSLPNCQVNRSPREASTADTLVLAL